MTLVITRDLTVRYGAVRALAPLTLTIPEGAWALLGPNGAGKSTLIRAMLGLTRASGGGLSVFGLNPYVHGANVRRRIGYMPESPALLPGLTGIQYVTLAARLSGVDRDAARKAAHVSLDDVGLGEARYRRVETYSTGMRQRAKLASALAHDPDLLVLDEPTNGLDPEGRDALLGLVKEITRERGKSLILSSHILPEVRKVCDKAIIIRRGSLAHVGPLADLQVDLGGVIVETLDAPAPLVRELRGQGFDVEEKGDLLVVQGDIDVPRVMGIASRTGVTIRSAKPHMRGVHDAAIELMEGET